MKTVSPRNRPEDLIALVNRFSSQWPSLSDKPEENPESGIRALWLAAA